MGRMVKKRLTASRAGWALAALLGWSAFGALVVASERLSETAQNASSLPDPGRDWILRAKSGERKEGGEDDGRPALDSVAAFGRIVAVDRNGIETEDRRRDICTAPTVC